MSIRYRVLVSFLAALILLSVILIIAMPSYTIFFICLACLGIIALVCFIVTLLLHKNPVTASPACSNGVNCPVTLELTLKNDLTELQRLSTEAEAFAHANALSDTETYNLLLVLEEVITNIISYGCNNDHSHQIIASISLDKGDLILVISDDGQAFNPLEAPMPDLDLPLDERPIGGLGIALFRSIMDSVDYQRKNNRNILSLKRTLQNT